MTVCTLMPCWAAQAQAQQQLYAQQYPISSQAGDYSGRGYGSYSQVGPLCAHRGEAPSSHHGVGNLSASCCAA